MLLFSILARGSGLDLEDRLRASTGLSEKHLQAGLAAVLGGVQREAAQECFKRLPSQRTTRSALVVLAGNLPALVVQSLLPALVLRLPTVFKVPRREPHFTPAFVGALIDRVPELSRCVLVRDWAGGESNEESEWLELVDTVIAYGGQEAIASLSDRARGTVLDYGPKLSLAVVSDGMVSESVCVGLARDIALFEQQGCLSIQAILVLSEGRELASSMIRALEQVAILWPPKKLSLDLGSSLQQVRGEARMRGLWVGDLPLSTGTVILEDGGPLVPSPGSRTIRVYSLESPDAVRSLLNGWDGRLQGATLLGASAKSLRPFLESLGVSRFAPPGTLQSTNAYWQNGGRDLFQVLGK